MQHDSTDLGEAILVTGGSGFIGQRLVGKLSTSGRTVVSMYHHKLPEVQPNVFPVCSDMSSTELLAAPLRGVSTVFHLAWENNLVGPSENEAWDPLVTTRLPRNVLNTKNLVRAMEKSGARRLIFVSALGASRHAKTSFLAEKYLSEFFVLNSTIPEKIILRPAVIWSGQSSADKFLNSIMKVMRMPGIYPVPASNRLISPLSVDDLIAGLERFAFEDVEHSACVLELRGPETLSVEELFRFVANKYLGKTRLPLTGMIGETLTPIFERNNGEDPRQPRLRHYLALSGDSLEMTKKDTAFLNGIMPCRTRLSETGVGAVVAKGPTL